MPKHAAAKVVPLAMLAVAWSIDLSGGTTATATQHDPATVEAPVVPTTAFGVPASVRTTGLIDLSPEFTATGGSVPDVPRTTSATTPQDIPTTALAAYQRAARVLYGVDKACAVDWALLAAIGRVESDHGRYGGSAIDATGVSRPDIIGIPLDGSNDTATIRDTDNGRLDGDTVWDRAVGPMQFIPSTWALVGVDGNGDGVRDPHNIDDAALASAVYLCADGGDLGTGSGARSAVLRYNHSDEYADLVLSIASAYRNGDYSPVASTPVPSIDPADLIGPSAQGRADARRLRVARGAVADLAGGESGKGGNVAAGAFGDGGGNAGNGAAADLDGAASANGANGADADLDNGEIDDADDGHAGNDTSGNENTGGENTSGTGGENTSGTGGENTSGTGGENETGAEPETETQPPPETEPETEPEPEPEPDTESEIQPEPEPENETGGNGADAGAQAVEPDVLATEEDAELYCTEQQIDEIEFDQATLDVCAEDVVGLSTDEAADVVAELLAHR